MRIRAKVLYSIAVVFLASHPAYAQQSETKSETGTPADADRALKAKRVSTRIAVHLDPNKKEIRYIADDEKNDIGHKAAGALFSTTSDLLVTYPRLNPFRTQATASISEVDDPTHTAVSQLIAAIAGVPGLVNPDFAKAGAGAPRTAARVLELAEPEKCPELVEAERVLGDIQTGLFGSTISAKNIGDEYKKWTDAFDAGFRDPGGGPKGAKDAADLIAQFNETVHAGAEGAAAAIKLAQERANAASRTTTAQQNYNETLARVLSGKSATDQAKALAANKTELENLRVAADASVSCAQDALNLYRLILLANPAVRLAEVRKLERALTDLAKVITTTYGPTEGTWFNNVEFVLAKDITVSRGKLSRVAVKALNVNVETDDATLRITPQEAASATFDIREYTTFVPELGIGATFAVLDRPKYGTATNAQGQTIVARAGTSEVSFSPTVMVNFVPVGLSGSVPIIQIGASTSTSAPAVFMGGGWRVPGAVGKSGIVVGVGFVLGWVKDLQTLIPDESVVTGTKDIENDLKFSAKPKPGMYLNIQYKF